MTQETVTTAEHAAVSSRRSTTMAGTVGNVLEWYDFAVYGYFAPVLARMFFPSEDHFASMLDAFAVFALGFFMRPIGGLIFGHIGDLMGRKKALMLSVMLMAIPTFLLGCLPTHAQIGTMAATLLVSLRLLQGIAVGGEYTSSVVFLVEQAPQDRRGFFGSWSVFGAVAGILLGSAVGALVTSIIPQADINTWGWRVPFLLGLLVGVAGWIIRRDAFKHDEKQLTVDQTERTKYPILEALKTEWRPILQLIGYTMLNAVGFYTMFVYVTTYLSSVVKIPLNSALEINTISMVVLLACIPYAGHLSDRYGRKRMLLISAVGCIVFGYPLFSLMHHTDLAMVLAGQLGFALLMGIFLGVGPATMVEMFQRKTRCSALSIAYNICLACFGGTSPMVATYLIQRTHDDLAPAFYIMAVATLSAACLLTIPETYKKSLE